MRRLWKFLIGTAVCCSLVLSGGLAASAVSLISEAGTETEVSVRPIAEGSAAPVSLALRNLAGDTDMAVASLVGELYYFSKEDFLRAMNLSSFEYLTVTRAPSADRGTLFLGESVVEAGQIISSANIGRLSYSSATAEAGVGDFGFSLDESGYSVSCLVYSSAETGEKPTGAYVPTSRLTSTTHRDLSYSGTLSGYDPDGDAIVYEIVSPSEHGAVRIVDREAGRYLYTPYRGYTGEDSFRYVVRDSYGNYSGVCTVTLSVTEPTVSVAFSDLTDDSSMNAALSMAENSIMSGTEVGGETFFYPERTVSRVDFLAMAMRTVGITDLGENTSTVFADDGAIPEALRGYVARAYELGVVNGIFGDGGLYFQPDRAVTRAEAAKILSTLIDLSASASEALGTPHDIAVGAVVFDDGSTIPSWAREAVYRLSALGIYVEDGGMASVNAPLTRGEAAEMLSRVLSAARQP